MSKESSQNQYYERLYSMFPLSNSSESLHYYEPKESLLHSTPKRPAHSKFWARLGLTTLTTINIILLITTAIIFKSSREGKSTEFECAAQTSEYSPLLEPGSNAIEYEHVEFKGALAHKSIYKGQPSKELDEAWIRLTHINNSAVDGDVIDRIGKSRIAVHYSEDRGGKYNVGVEVFHQLHCLNLIRKYTYRDYYDRPENKPNGLSDHEDILRAHVDHCIEMLRQVLQCQGDVGIITFNWVKGFGIYPDFTTKHKCRKLDKILSWSDEHAAPDGDPTSSADSVWLAEPPP